MIWKKKMNQILVLKETWAGVVVDLLDCNIVINRFELQLRSYIHFQTNTLGNGMNFLISPCID